MEYLEGTSLESLVDAEKPLPLEQVKKILRDVTAGLREAHALGAVHRDLKPSNVMLTGDRLKILDFGIARMDGFDSRLTQTGTAVGSPRYMAPEQLQGETTDGRSDFYSLGVMSFELLTGRAPFESSSLTALVLDHLHTPPPSLASLRPGLPAAWPTLVGKLLAKLPGERYQSAGELAAAIDELP